VTEVRKWTIPKIFIAHRVNKPELSGAVFACSHFRILYVPTPRKSRYSPLNNQKYPLP